MLDGLEFGDGRLANCTRSLAYLRAASNAARPIPTAHAPMPTRPLSRIFNVSKKPWFSAPRRWASESCTSSRISSVVSEACRPIFSMRLPVRKPGMPRSTMNAVRPFCISDGSVDARMTKISPTEPWVMNVLVPVRLQPSPVRTARVRAAAASEPEPGSVNPPPANSAVAARQPRSVLRRCSSLPARKMCPVHSELCEAMVSPTDASARATSSSATT